MRKPHYWKPAGRSAAPSEIVCLDTETHAGPSTEVAGGEYHTLRLGVAVSYRLDKGRRTREKWLTFTDPADFWDLVCSRLSKHRPVWIFGHNLPYDLGAVGGWRFLQSGVYDVEKAVLEGQMFFVLGFVEESRLNFCDTFNYYKCSLASIGKALGLAKLPMPEWEAPDSEWAAYCRRDVEVTAAAVDTLVGFVREHELGPWQPTIAGLAFSAFRRRFMSHKVLVHDYKDALAVERSAYYGGVVDTPIVGKEIGGPVYELDVCSMYPAVCCLPLPSRIVAFSPACTLHSLRQLASQYLLVADVTLRTDRDTYPCRVGDRVYHPTGEYRTCLPHPELVAALERGHIRDVHYAAWFTRDLLFERYMHYFVDMKSRYRKEGNEAFSTVAKYLLNSLYGKTGQLTPRWWEWGEDALAELEVRHGLPAGALTYLAPHPPDLYLAEETMSVAEWGVTLRLRNYWGGLEVEVGEAESRDSCPAVAATVTSYARLLLRGYQATAGEGHWYYSDTDSIWVDKEGLKRLKASGCVADEVLGKLSVKREYSRLIVHGPKDYEADEVVKRKGVRPRAEPTDDGGYSQLHFPSAKSMLLRGPWTGVFVRRAVKHLRRTIDRGVLLDDGTVRPFVFPQEMPEQKNTRTVLTGHRGVGYSTYTLTSPPTVRGDAGHRG